MDSNSTETTVVITYIRFLSHKSGFIRATPCAQQQRLLIKLKTIIIICTEEEKKKKKKKKKNNNNMR